MPEPPPKVYELELGDWPGGMILAMECEYPYAPDGGIDLALPLVCTTHQRSVWWCLNAGLTWCDGGPPFDEPHVWP